MDILTKITVPNYIYRFYEQTSQHVAGYSAGDLMADALSAYAGLISEEVAKKREDIMFESAKEDNSY